MDVFVLRDSPYDREAFGRVRRDTLDDAVGAPPLCLVSPEDLVLRKLEWFRAGGEVSERQWSDVLGVLKVQAESLDTGYLRRWAAGLGLGDLLERALLEVSPGMDRPGSG